MIHFVYLQVYLSNQGYKYVSFDYYAVLGLCQTLPPSMIETIKYNLSQIQQIKQRTAIKRLKIRGWRGDMCNICRIATLIDRLKIIISKLLIRLQVATTRFLICSFIHLLLALYKFQVFQLHRVLGSCEFQWCLFHPCIFSKNSPNIQLMRFSLHKGKNFFAHVFWVTNHLSAADMVPAVFFRT